jgi:hypothetical protein
MSAAAGRWHRFGDDRPRPLLIGGDPLKQLRQYEATHWRMSDLVRLYGLPRHKLTLLLPRPDVTLTCCRRMRLWERTRVLATLGAPS